MTALMCTYSLAGLWNYTRYLNEQGMDSNSYLLAFWGKLLQPLSILGLVRSSKKRTLRVRDCGTRCAGALT